MVLLTPAKINDPNFTLLDVTLANTGIYTGTALSPDYCTDTTQSTLTVVQSSNLAISTGPGTVCETILIDGDNDLTYASGCGAINGLCVILIIQMQLPVS